MSTSAAGRRARCSSFLSVVRVNRRGTTRTPTQKRSAAVAAALSASSTCMRAHEARAHALRVRKLSAPRHCCGGDGGGDGARGVVCVRA